MNDWLDLQEMLEMQAQEKAEEEVRNESDYR